MTVTFETRIGPGFVPGPTYEGMFFPAGEAHVKVRQEIEGSGVLTQVAYIDSADANDLMLVAMWADAIYRRNAQRDERPDWIDEQAVLVIPYLPGARADHYEFIPRGAEVYADFINSMHLDQVICFDPHSEIMPSLINNIIVVDSTRLVRKYIVGKADWVQQYDGIIAPDKGAVKRAKAVADACHLPLYKAEKHRNPDTGKLSEFTCEELPAEGKFLVVDDICDGGGTFMGLATATGLPMERLGLYVSHGVFSGQAENLFAYYQTIHTTDSLASATLFAEKHKKTLIDPKRIDVIALKPTLKGYIK